MQVDNTFHNQKISISDKETVTHGITAVRFIFIGEYFN